MIRRRINLLEWWFTITYRLVPFIAFSVASYIRFWSGYFEHEDFDIYPYVFSIIVVTVVWAFVLEHYRLNRMEVICGNQVDLSKNAKATAATMGLVLAATFFYRQASFSRIFVVAAGVLIFVLSIVIHLVFRRLISKQGSLPLTGWRVAFLGADESAARLAEKFERQPLIPCEIMVFVSLPGQTPASVPGPVLGWEQLEEVVDTYRCQELLIVIPFGSFGDREEVFGRVRNLPIPARIVLDLGDGIFAPDRIFDFYGITLLDVKPYPVDTIGYLLAKRVFDVVFSLAALVVTAPLTAIIALAIKLTSPGPVFFVQERISLSGKRFGMLKFRSMVLQDNRTSNSHHTSREDPRVTAVGRFLRKTSLDEWPQFINVLKGDMSVVGPRPELTYFVQKFRGDIPSYMARHNVKCGITGWAQINGLRGSDTSIPRRIEYDLHYIQNWSLWFDMKIIFLTLLRGLLSRNAY